LFKLLAASLNKPQTGQIRDRRGKKKFSPVQTRYTKRCEVLVEVKMTMLLFYSNVPVFPRITLSPHSGLKCWTADMTMQTVRFTIFFHLPTSLQASSQPTRTPSSLTLDMANTLSMDGFFILQTNEWKQTYSIFKELLTHMSLDENPTE
jgi:hypothetical protein